MDRFNSNPVLDILKNYESKQENFQNFYYFCRIDEYKEKRFLDIELENFFRFLKRNFCIEDYKIKNTFLYNIKDYDYGHLIISWIDNENKLYLETILWQYHIKG